MFTIKNIIFLFVYTLLFSTLLFLIQSIFFTFPEEEIYIEPSLVNFEVFDEVGGYYSFSGADIITQEIQKEREKRILKNTLSPSDSQDRKASSISREVSYHFIPQEIQPLSDTSYIPGIQTFLEFPYIGKSVDELEVYVYKNIGEIRGRMKNKIIHMFGVGTVSPEEFLSVFIHEFGHYYDVYILQKGSFGDESQRFYDISWQAQSTLKLRATQSDFVSGYAMTNQYEDFAESYAYYILHNKDFYLRAQASTALREKYDFFEKYIFSTKEFFKEDFGGDTEVKSYYWDITKIPIDIEKFLQYLQKDI